MRRAARRAGLGVAVAAAAAAGCATPAATGSTTIERDGGRSVTVRVGTGRDEAQTPLDRSRPPEVGAPRSMRLPEPARFTLSNGLPVVLVERHELPVVSLQLLLMGGATSLTGEHAGLAALTADMIDEGTPTRTALEVATELERLGASFSSTAGVDASQVELVVLRHRLEQALDLMAEIVTAPTFPEAELERVRDERVTRVLQDLDEPRALANNAFATVLYGPDHPYGAPLLGTRASLESLTRDDVVGFYRRHYHAGNATLLVAGDVEADSLRAMLEARFGGWEAGPPARAAAPQAQGLDAPRIVIVDRPGAAQSEIRVGKVAVERATADYFALTALNTVLGGSFTSRLNAKLREEKGYTYGAGSGFAMRRSPGPFVAQAAVHTPVTDSAVAVFLEEIRRIRDARVPDDELERAKRYVALRLPQRFETVGDLTARLAETAVYDLPDDYWSAYVERLLAVDAAAVQRAARDHLDPGRMIVVVAGDRAAIEAPLRALGLPVDVLPAEPAAEVR